jgi:hypothetical protein
VENVVGIFHIDFSYPFLQPESKKGSLLNPHCGNLLYSRLGSPGKGGCSILPQNEASGVSHSHASPHSAYNSSHCEFSYQFIASVVSVPVSRSQFLYLSGCPCLDRFFWGSVLSCVLSSLMCPRKVIAFQIL